MAKKTTTAKTVPAETPKPAKVSKRSAALMAALDKLERKIKRTAERASSKVQRVLKKARPRPKKKARPSSGAKATRAARGRSKR